MASPSSSSSQPITVRWSQRRSHVTLSISGGLLEPDEVSFLSDRVVRLRPGLELELLHPIVVSSCRRTATTLRLDKADRAARYWPTLLAKPTEPGISVGVDWDRWIDEDDDEALLPSVDVAVAPSVDVEEPSDPIPVETVDEVLDLTGGQVVV
jgi:hypothetical protein